MKRLVLLVFFGTLLHAQTIPMNTLKGKEAAAFADGKTLIVYAHQDDDLLWMLPFWGYARKFILSAYPPAEAMAEMGTKMPEHWQDNWVKLWGDTISNRKYASQWESCKRVWCRLSEEVLIEKLEPYIADENTLRVVTHNPWGEYGHPVHRLVSKVVVDLTVKYKKDAWCLGVALFQKEKVADLLEDILPLKEVVEQSVANNPFLYVNVRKTGLKSLKGHFVQDFFLDMRRQYLETHYDCRVDCTDDDNIWTWWYCRTCYPTRWRPFLKMVDQGTDEVRGNAEIERLMEVIQWRSCPVPADANVRW